MATEIKINSVNYPLCKQCKKNFDKINKYIRNGGSFENIDLVFTQPSNLNSWELHLDKVYITETEDATIKKLQTRKAQLTKQLADTEKKLSYWRK